MSEHVYLCLTDLLDADMTSFEYFQSLSSPIQAALRQREISTFDELQEQVSRIRQSGID